MRRDTEVLRQAKLHFLNRRTSVSLRSCSNFLYTTYTWTVVDFFLDQVIEGMLNKESWWIVQHYKMNQTDVKLHLRRSQSGQSQEHGFESSRYTADIILITLLCLFQLTFTMWSSCWGSDRAHCQGSFSLQVRIVVLNDMLCIHN